MIARILLILTFLFFRGVSYAQELSLSVESFNLEENALTAKNEPVYDNNNQKCALVIIKGMGEEKLRFNTGNSFIQVGEKKVDGERAYLMWIPEGVIKVTISSDSKSFEPIEYYFNPRVKKAETYLMNLHLEELKNSIGKQFLEFVIEPQGATLEVNNELWQLSDGIAYRQLPKGKYQYQIKAKDYYTETGIVDFSDLSTKKSIYINLKPNFGWLIISPIISDITVFIDDEPYSGDFNKIRLSSGTHTIKVAKELYQTYTGNVKIEDNKETPLAIDLKPNFSIVSINVVGGADIYIDDKLMCENSWTGKLGVGNYKVELKKMNHSAISETISVKKIGETLNFDYKGLKPILGSVSVESTPIRANVKIDGIDYGTTPVLIPEIIIGNHNITLMLPDYKTKNATIEVKEGEQSNVKYELEKSSSHQNNAPVRHDGMTVHATYNVDNSTIKQRYGIVDIAKVISSMPEYNKIQETLSKMQHRGNSQKEIDDYQKKEMDKLKQRVRNIVRIVSQKEKLVFVLPEGTAAYMGEDLVDITNKVINKLKK